MRSIYNISLTRTALLLSPIGLRRKMLTAFIKAFMLPLELLNEDFATYRAAVDTSVLCQICYMRGMLNDNFDFYERRIKVRTRSSNRDYHMLWQRQYYKPLMLYNRNFSDSYESHLINKRGEIGVREPDFEIVLPQGYDLSDDERNRMGTMVNEHKLASKTFIITHG